MIIHVLPLPRNAVAELEYRFLPRSRHGYNPPRSFAILSPYCTSESRRVSMVSEAPQPNRSNSNQEVAKEPDRSERHPRAPINLMEEVSNCKGKPQHTADRYDTNVPASSALSHSSLVSHTPGALIRSQNLLAVYASSFTQQSIHIVPSPRCSLGCL